MNAIQPNKTTSFGASSSTAVSKDQLSQYGKNSYDYVKRVGAVASESDKELWGLITDVPRLSGIWPYIAAIFNVVLAGTGTILAGCMGDQIWNKTQVLVGLIQMLTSVYFVGWIASIYWAYLIVTKALKDK
jgi:hypothetical protein